MLDAACNSFLAEHAADIASHDAQQTFADAAAADWQRPNYTADSLVSYRQLLPEVPDARPRIKRLASALYAAGNDARHGALLAQLLDPGIAAVAALARHDSNKYHLIKREQPNQTTLYHRLGWVCEQANSIRTLAHAMLGPHAKGFGQALHTELQPLSLIVNGLEMLQAHLREPETIPMNDPKAWSVHPL